ncbi:MAG: PEP-CTERM sorting domain-containing protein [Fimbriimonadaceae bacterium]|nr:PEP-CTERM sorting domain-containing protein [Fimbriimonadaceae bacterium]QYK55366.1 MAG: PEP-CTERM sorting domain-containing protein [Fimbriimonadaceae bacterium]
MKRTQYLSALVVGLVGSLAGRANASEYQWVWDGDTSGTNMSGGVVTDIRSTFNTVSQRFTFTANFAATPQNDKTEGFWLAVSGGPNPKGHAGELALMYFDATTFLNGGDPTLTVYAYNGINGDTSYQDGAPQAGNQPPDKIVSSKVTTSWINQLSVVNEANGTRTMKVDLDATAINAHVPANPGPGGPGEWTGLAYGEHIGIWFHQVSGLTTQYENGFLKENGGWQWRKQGWIDLHDKPTESVPEPATIIALGAGVAAFLRRKRA